MANIAIFRINYKSDFILTLNSDAGWMTPFCIKFWTGAPSQAYFASYDGTTYTHCAPVDGEPTKLRVQFDDHHLPIGDLKFQIGYHFTVDDFPTSVEDEVLNQASVIIEVDDAPAQVMLDLNGETAPEIQFSLPAYANEAQRIANEQQRIANEQQRIQNEETRIVREETRQRNEATRIAQEEARVSEFARLKRESQQATTDANDAATLANQKAQLAQDKATLAQEAATLANQKAQLAADKAALANDAAQLANEKAALAQQKAEYAQQHGTYAKNQGDYAKEQGNYAKAKGVIAEEDHQRAEADHGIAVDDHTQAGNDHTRAESDHGIAADDHTQAGNDHTRAESDHGIAADDHTQAGNDHTRAEADHGIAADDHTQAGNDHTRAESDHTRAESDHTAVEVYVDSLGVFDLSKHNAVGGVLATYANLDAALTALNAIDSQYKYGGMSFKFVQSSDNKYVQYRLAAPNWSTDIHDWTSEDPYFIDKIMQEVNEAIDAHTPIEITGDVTNAPDEEDLTSVNVGGTDVLKLKDRAYNPLTYSGMGRVYLRKNIVDGVNTLTKDMFYKGEAGSRESNTNTIFVIQYDYTLAENITIPANCVLEFDGGSISGGRTITGNNTDIQAGLVKIFTTDVIFAGSWNINEIYPEWFGAKGDGITDNSDAFQKCFNNTEILGSHIRVTGKVYKFLTTITTVRLIDLDIDKGVVLKYYGNGNFVNVGRSQDNKKMDGVIRGGIWEMANHNTGDVFHIIWAIHLRFVEVYSLYGATSFNTNHSDFRGAWYCYFIDCYAHATGDACFNMRPYTGKQNNQIQFIRCNAKLSTNGFVIGGAAISMIGCCAEACGSYGICVPDDVIARSLSIDTLYTEQNPDGPVYIGQSLSDSPKRDISINSIYDLSGKKCVINIGDIECKEYNIYYDDKYIRESPNQIKNGIAIYGKPNYILFASVGCVRLPAIVEYNNNKPNTAVLTLGMLINGRLLEVNQGDLTSVISREITSIDDNVITFDEAVTDDYDMISIICNNHPLHFLSKQCLRKYPLITVGNYGTRDAAYVFRCETSAFSADRTSITLTSTITSYCKNINVGDIVYFTKSSSTSSWTTASLVSGSARRIVDIPNTLKSHPLYDRFVTARIAQNVPSTTIAFDYLTIQSLNDVMCTGTFDDKPNSADIYEGFKYFCTDKQSAEGATDGIMIYHKGNNVWVDALGRVVS